MSTPLSLASDGPAPEFLPLIEGLEHIVQIIDQYTRQSDDTLKCVTIEDVCDQLQSPRDVELLLEQLESLLKTLDTWERLGSGGTPLLAARECTFFQVLLMESVESLQLRRYLEERGSPAEQIAEATIRAGRYLMQLGDHRTRVNCLRNRLWNIGRSPAETRPDYYYPTPTELEMLQALREIGRAAEASEIGWKAHFMDRENSLKHLNNMKRKGFVKHTRGYGYWLPEWGQPRVTPTE